MPATKNVATSHGVIPLSAFGRNGMSRLPPFVKSAPGCFRNHAVLRWPAGADFSRQQALQLGVLVKELMLQSAGQVCDPQHIQQLGRDGV